MKRCATSEPAMPENIQREPFSEIMRSEKIEEDFSLPYTPELNGISEKFNKTLQWKIRALLVDST